MMSHIEMEYAKTLKQVSQLERELAEKTRLLSESDVAVIRIANQADQYLQQRNVAIAKLEELRVRLECKKEGGK